MCSYWCTDRGMQDFWSAYLAAMEGAGFNQSNPLYVASGLLTYMNATGTGSFQD